MAKTKKAKKTVKSTKAEPAKKAKRTAAPEAEAPKKAKKSKKAASAEKGKPEKRARKWMSSLIATKDIPSKAMKLIQQADDLETQIADAKDALETKLNEIQEALGGPSFEHPDRGPMTIMHRNEKTFWRAKPSGK